MYDVFIYRRTHILEEVVPDTIPPHPFAGIKWLINLVFGQAEMC